MICCGCGGIGYYFTFLLEQLPLATSMGFHRRTLVRYFLRISKPKNWAPELSVAAQPLRPFESSGDWVSILQCPFRGRSKQLNLAISQGFCRRALTQLSLLQTQGSRTRTRRWSKITSICGWQSMKTRGWLRWPYVFGEFLNNHF